MNEQQAAIKAGRRATDPVIIIPTGESPMAKANAEVKAKEFNTAAKTLAKRGVTRPKHIPAPVSSDPTDKRGIDGQPDSVVESGFSIFNQTGAPEMAKTPKTQAAVATASTTPVNAETRAASDEKIKADIAAKSAAKELAAKEKAEKTAALVAKRESEAKARADAAAAREAKAAENKAVREAKAAQLAESGRTYTGSMLALADRVKAGVYVKSLTGQLRSTDALAEALDAVPAENVVKLGTTLFNEPNKYTSLNIGQQSMNYRNRLRGAIKKGLEVNGNVITLDLIKQVRDANGLATGEALHAEKLAKQEARAKAKEAAEAAKKAKEDAAAKAKADKAAAPKTEPAAAAA